MKMRSYERFAEVLERDLTPRKLELTNLKYIVEKQRDAYSPVALRAALPLLYAHWEGYVKFGANRYLEYVTQQKHGYAELIPSLVGLALRGRILQAQQSDHSHRGRTELMEFILNHSGDRARLPHDRLADDEEAQGAIATSNLKWTVLKDILELIGQSPAPYELKKGLLEEKLLGARNKSAHGQTTEQGKLVQVEAAEYGELHDSVLELLNYFHNDILNAAARRAYLRG